MSSFLCNPSPQYAVPNLGDASLRVPAVDATLPVIVTGGHVTSDVGTTRIEGVSKGGAAVGDAEDIDSMIFHVTDFHDYFGHPIREGTGRHSWTGRLNLSARDWVVTIDAVADVREARCRGEEWRRSNHAHREAGVPKRRIVYGLRLQ